MATMPLWRWSFQDFFFGSAVVWWFEDCKSKTTNKHALNCGQKGVVKGILSELPGFRLLGYAAQLSNDKTDANVWQ